MNYTELMNRIEELKSRKGRGSISADETFSLLMELAEKTRAVDINAGSLTIRRLYTSVAAMNADQNPVDQETGKPLKFGQLACVCNSNDLTQTDNGKIYHYNKPGWKFLRQVGDMVQFAKEEDVDNKITLISEELTEHTKTYILKSDTPQTRLFGEMVAEVFVTGANLAEGQYYVINYFGLNSPNFENSPLGLQMAVKDANGAVSKPSNYKYLTASNLVKNAEIVLSYGSPLSDEGVKVILKLSNTYNQPSKIIFDYINIVLSKSSWNYVLNPNLSNYVDDNYAKLHNFNATFETNPLVFNDFTTEVGINPGYGASNVNGSLVVSAGNTGLGSNISYNLLSNRVNGNDGYFTDMYIRSIYKPSKRLEKSDFTAISVIHDTNSKSFINTNKKVIINILDDNTIIIEHYINIPSVTSYSLTRIQVACSLNSNKTFLNQFILSLDLKNSYATFGVPPQYKTGNQLLLDKTVKELSEKIENQTYNILLSNAPSIDFRKLISGIYITGLDNNSNRAYRLGYFGLNAIQFAGYIGIQLVLSDGSTWINPSNYYIPNTVSLIPGQTVMMSGGETLAALGVHVYLVMSNTYKKPSKSILYSSVWESIELLPCSWSNFVVPPVMEAINTVSGISNTTITVSADVTDADAQYTGANAIQLALNSITDASSRKRYTIYVKSGLYKITNSSQYLGYTGYPAMFVPKDYVDIVGQCKEDCVIWAELPYNDSEIDTNIERNSHQTVYNWAKDCTIENLTLVAKNIRYVIHQDNPGEANKKRYYNNVDICFIGNKGSLRCWGIGTHTGSETYCKNGKSVGCIAPAAFHNSVNAKKASKFGFNNYQFINQSGNSFVLLQNSGTLLSDIFELEGCSFGGAYILDYLDWWIYQPGVNDSYNGAEWKIIGSKNKAFYFNNRTQNVSLRIDSNSLGTNSSIRFDVNSSAYSILVKNPRSKFGHIGSPDRRIVDKYIVFDGSTGLNGYAIGCVSVRETNYPFGTTTSQDGMGKRLGDCSIINKILTVIVDEITYNVIFNKDYTSYTNKQVLQEINNVIGVTAKASEYNIGLDYYPELSDVLTIATNASATEPILSGTVVKIVAGKIVPCTGTDEIYGVVIDDIPRYSDVNGEISVSCRGNFCFLQLKLSERCIHLILIHPISFIAYLTPHNLIYCKLKIISDLKTGI